VETILLQKGRKGGGPYIQSGKKVCIGGRELKVPRTGGEGGREKEHGSVVVCWKEGEREKDT